MLPPACARNARDRLVHAGVSGVGQHILLATVDDDGSVSFGRCFGHVQPPTEGPGLIGALSGVGTPAAAAAADSDEEG